MKILVAYDSYFGNTQKIAEAVAGGFAPHHSVEITRISELKPAQLQGVELLVVGSPTRAFNASDATRAFLKLLPPAALRGIKVAAFDTRIDAAKGPGILRFLAGIFGYAAVPIANGLAKKGGSPVGVPAGFFVKASEGPLEEGELDRAAAWARTL